MNEYISKQSVIDYLNGYLDSIVECGADSLFDATLFDKGQRKALVKSIQDIDNMPTVEAEHDNGWISVKDRLPDDKKRYLICTKSGRIDIAYYQPTGDKFSNHEPFWQGGSCRFTAATHWRPLPDPPKNEDKEVIANAEKK